MDRISALRNIEEALTEFEAGEHSLESLEREVRGVIRTYATAFEDDLAAWRASGSGDVDGLVVVADSRAAARERVADLIDSPGEFEVQRRE